jgi:hypothetical protein
MCVGQSNTANSTKINIPRQVGENYARKKEKISLARRVRGASSVVVSLILNLNEKNIFFAYF